MHTEAFDACYVEQYSVSHKIIIELHTSAHVTTEALLANRDA